MLAQTPPMLLPVAAMIIGFAMRRFHVHSFWPYLLIAGSMSWLGFAKAGLHPALGLLRPGRIDRRFRRVSAVPVRAPFPRAGVHVADAPRIRLLVFGRSTA